MAGHRRRNDQPLASPGVLTARYDAVRAATLALAEPLSPEDCALQSMPDASPVKWHLAHTSWFFETFLLSPSLAGYRAFDPAFKALYNSYYNAVGDRHPRPERGLISRPDHGAVLDYRAHVDAGMRRLFASGNAALLPLIELGLNHEQQHQELVLTDVKHLLSRNPRSPAYRKHWPLTAIRARRPRWLGFEGCPHEIGHDGPGCAFDS